MVKVRVGKLQLRERRKKKATKSRAPMHAAKAKHATGWQMHATDILAASTDFGTETKRKQDKVKATEKTVATPEESSPRDRQAEAGNHALIHKPVNGQEISVKRSPNTPATAVVVRHACIRSGWDGV